MSSQFVEHFLRTWEFESKLTSQLLKTIPKDELEFRPDPDGRSMGELAWHLVGLEAMMSSIALNRRFDPTMAPGTERPRTVDELATGYERVHREAVERVRAIRPEDLDQEFPFLGRPISVRDLLRFALLHHLIHHRGQLTVMIRLAHGVPSAIYGPSREDSAAARSAARPSR